MSAAPFDVRQVQERLRERVNRLRLVGLAGDYGSVKQLSDFPTPAAYVVLANERATSNPAGHAPPGQQIKARQIVVAQFGVVLALRNYREQRGEQLADEAKEILGAVRTAILGWVPNLPGARACELVAGKVEDYDASTLLWADLYKTQHSIGNSL